MPRYDFYCARCEGTFEIQVPMSRIGKSKMNCAVCGWRLRRVYHAPPVIYEQGSGGFYSKDYAPGASKEDLEHGTS